MSTPDGGPAFPTTRSEALSDGIDGGMSIRDVFAAAPMTDVELETLRQSFEKKFPHLPLSIAALRYFRADTMLEARAQWYNEKRVPEPVQVPVVIPPQPGEEMQ